MTISACWDLSQMEPRSPPTSPDTGRWLHEQSLLQVQTRSRALGFRHLGERGGAGQLLVEMRKPSEDGGLTS